MNEALNLFRVSCVVLYCGMYQNNSFTLPIYSYNSGGI